MASTAPLPATGWVLGPLVGDQPPLAARVGVVDPGVVRTRVTSAVTRLPMYSANDSLSQRSSHHVGVDEVAEPLVRHLVGDGGGAGDALRRGSPALVKTSGSRNVTQPGFSIAPALNSGHERLVVVAERVADPEQPVELVEALPGQREQLVGVARRGAAAMLAAR